jgi:hypothetical protein
LLLNPQITGASAGINNLLPEQKIHRDHSAILLEVAANQGLHHLASAHQTKLLHLAVRRHRHKALGQLQLEHELLLQRNALPQIAVRDRAHSPQTRRILTTTAGLFLQLLSFSLV